MTRIKKYRPSLTKEQLEYIVASIKKEAQLNTMSFSIIQTLDTYLYKISNNAVAPSSIAAPPKPSTLESLGGVAIDNITNNTNTLATATATATKEEYWELCYKKWEANPANCTLEEIQCANEHRYLNDLMSPEEVAAFEKQQFTDYNQ